MRLGRSRARCGSRVRIDALLVALAALACAEQREAGVGAPDVLVVVLDACRADRMGAYGHDRPTTPTLDELARDPDAVLFRRHYVQGQGAWTKTFTASFFTGLHPFQHGVTLGEAGRAWRGSPAVPATHVLHERHETLAERFRAAGYRTFFLPRSRHLLAGDGLGQGFDEFHGADVVRGDRARVEKLLELLARLPSPVFGHVHLSACHLPFRARDRDPEFMGEFGFGYDEAARQGLGIDFTDAALKRAINRGERALAPEDVRFLGLVYDAKLRATDRGTVAPLLRGLRELDRYDRTLLVVTADHGAELYEHGGYAHDHALWDEVVRVPLIVKFPRGRRPPALAFGVDEPTQSTDLGVSLLAFAAPPGVGASLEADLFAGQGRGFAYTELEREWALVRDGYKLIHGPRGDRLFDLRRDPGERRDLAAEQPQRVTAMRAEGVSLRGGR